MQFLSMYRFPLRLLATINYTLSNRFMNATRNKLPSLGHRARNIVAGKSLRTLVAIAWFGSHAAAANLLLDGSFENIAGVPDNYYSLFTGSLGDGWNVTQGTILI